MNGKQPIRPVFIVAQYKSGTSWLLQALCAHPRAIGVPEIDVVRAAYDNPEKSIPASPDDRIERFLAGWCPWREVDGRRWTPADLREALEQGSPIPQPAPGPNRMRSCFQVPREALANMCVALANAHTPFEAMDAFVTAATTDAGPATYLILKAADQIVVMDRLMEWQPDAPKIAIVRDGRDAAISALRFRSLMKTMNAPFRNRKELDYWRILETWADRAAMVRKRADAGQLRVVRYEDLTRDFVGTLRPLLDWLGLDSSDEIISAIDRKTSFEAVTGRPRGTEADSIRRKGEVGEWTDALARDEKNRAWRMAGRQLAAFGYTEDGSDHADLRDRFHATVIG